MQAVKTDQHNKFAEEKKMYSFFVSAKSGDMLSSCFYKIAADLAGIQVSTPVQEYS
jgi:Ras-related protein Rab-28